MSFGFVLYQKCLFNSTVFADTVRRHSEIEADFISAVRLSAEYIHRVVLEQSQIELITALKVILILIRLPPRNV